ncbi:sodium-dependent transporter [Clostridium sp. DSM 100503]|uniref:sodium-dependent transporter n=1 Tax=Clostridium sp. DSM 100503 TaxID=2963282 RepID=UPI002149ABFD|nr:sodium-dependent transporter [Clostridium sp. DSM 100503]MCR1952423.1 sodium-dependent transporter [Clostridium sp. DSM 100503]
MEENREQWGSKLGFIIAAVGSAVGLGNIWRFPYVAYTNGGGAFLIPYFFAIFTAGIPLLILEYGLGHKYKGSTPLAIAKVKKKWEWLGWWPTINAFIILTYYSMILSWAVNYLRFSINKGWGSDTDTFFHLDFIKLTNSPFDMGGIILPILIGIAIICFISWFICYKGIKGGIEKANKILLPALVIIMVIIAIRAVNLEGATEGLNTLFTPDWSKVREPKVWVAAYGQVFFSLSLAMGIMITYSSYLPRKTDINNSAFMTAFANCGFEFLSAIAVFSILGFMSSAKGVPMSEVVSSGVGLAFVVFPAVFTEMGAVGTFLGVLFFLCLLFAGITSSVSLIEAVSAPFIDKFGLARNKVVAVICLIGFSIGILYSTGAGLYLLDIIDNFINNYGIVVVGLLEVILIGWIASPDIVREHTNEISYFKIGKWWNICVKFVTPAILIFMLVQSIMTEIKMPYGGYELSAIFAYGWSIIGFGIILALIISKKQWKSKNILE